MKPFYVLLLCFFYHTISFSQTSLKGKVITSDTHKPVALANVFLSNTSVGTVTNENGEFVIEHFPDGRFDLVVSFIGYESYVVSIQSNRLPVNLSIVLKPKVNELQEVIVEPYEKNGWEKWGIFFIEKFIGTTAFAKDCKLLNKEVVKFRHNRKNNILQVMADDRLVIENRALGYVLKYDLTRFEFDFKEQLCLYQGYPLFEEMETKRNGLRKKWTENRQDAYYGSIMHFMRSLYRNKLIEQHFQVRKLIKISEYEKKRVRAAYQAQLKKSMSDGTIVTIDNTAGGFNPDTLAYYRKVMTQPESMDVLIDKVLSGDSIAFGIDSTVIGIEFSDHLQIVYLLKNPPDEYYRSSFRSPSKTPITSELFRVNNEVIMAWANGSYYEGTHLITSGYWAWSEKIGQLLPTSYWPPPKKK
jgi:hypothetical protein